MLWAWEERSSFINNMHDLDRPLCSFDAWRMYKNMFPKWKASMLLSNLTPNKHIQEEPVRNYK